MSDLVLQLEFMNHDFSKGILIVHMIYQDAYPSRVDTISRVLGALRALHHQRGIRMIKKSLVGVAAALFLALLGSHGTAGGGDTHQEAQDRVQIEKLMWQYTRALDSENADAYAAAYTPDGQFGSGANVVKGSDALKKMITDLRQRAAEAEAKGEKRPAMYHMEANGYLEFVDKDHARLQAYWMTVFAGAGPTVPVRVAAAGRDVDELVRVNGQWLIKSRDVAPKD
jgi:SnoaL-like domain